jgi:hypothetical protein
MTPLSQPIHTPANSARSAARPLVEREANIERVGARPGEAGSQEPTRSSSQAMASTAASVSSAIVRGPGFEDHCVGGPGDRHGDPRAGH